jgi:Tfp pilus assembly protein PilZ
MVLSSEVDIINLSLGGLAIRANRRLNIGSECTLTLDVHDKPLKTTGIVVWSVLTDIGRRGEDSVPYYSAGLRFVDILSDKVQDLMDFIELHKMAQEHRLSGIRFQIRAEGKAMLDGLQAYNVKLISLSGMLMETDRAFELDEVYRMEILPADADPIEFTGRVASIVEVDLEEGAAPLHQMGIEFVEMTSEDRERLTAFVQGVSEA